MPLSTPITVHGTRQRADARSSRRPGFSLVELLVSISIIALLVGLTLTALSGVSGSEQVLKSRNNLRQIHTWIQNYANNHKDRVVPSQFDYLDENGTEIGKIASATGYTATGNSDLEWLPSNNLYGTTGDPRADLVAQGSWADTLWVETNLGDDVAMADIPLISPNGSGVSGPSSDLYLSYRYRAPDIGTCMTTTPTSIDIHCVRMRRIRTIFRVMKRMVRLSTSIIPTSDLPVRTDQSGCPSRSVQAPGKRACQASLLRTTSSMRDPSVTRMVMTTVLQWIAM